MNKIIHRIFFKSFYPYEDKFQHYLSTWKKELPDYEIHMWDESKLDINENKWISQSFKANDPVFISEYIRWKATKEFGGIYLDADCEVINGKQFDSLVEDLIKTSEYDAFIGVEEFQNGRPTAQTFAAKKESNLTNFMYDMYNKYLSSPLWHWRNERQLLGPDLLTLYFRENGLNKTKGFITNLTEPIIIGRVKIYPADYFSPKFSISGRKLNFTKNTSIYHFFSNFNVENANPYHEFLKINPQLFDDYRKSYGIMKIIKHALSNPKKYIDYFTSKLK